ncbi:Ribonuclease/ribotoxin [Elaphomyces granulatus]
MQFTKAFLALALVAAPIFAAPTAVAEDGQLESRAVNRSLTLQLLWILQTYVYCRPVINASNTRSFKVDVDNAQSQAKAAGFTAGKSGDPHGYGNGDHIIWGVTNCDDGRSPLFEYPVFWEGAKQKEWQKDTRTSSQEKTPIRVVYANKNGGIVYCGIMTHSEVLVNHQGMAFFQQCD